MAEQDIAYLAFNRGLISPLALARADVKRTALSAEVMENCMPRVMGSMMLRPGLKYLGNSYLNAPTREIPFVFSVTDKAVIEFTDSAMVVYVDGDTLVTRNAVATTITNGNFNTDLTGWTDDDQPGGVSAWAAPNYMGFTGDGTNYAIREQHVVVAGGDLNVEQALRIVIARGPVTLMVGSTSGADDLVAQTDLGTGTHSLAFTPTGDYYVRFQSNLQRITYVDSCNVEAAGTMALPTPWVLADLGLIRFDQSADIIYVACNGLQQRQIERRSPSSWSVVLYETNDGPFRVINTGSTTLAAAALNGNTTLTASANLFKTTHLGALFMLTSIGQSVQDTFSADNVFTNPIEVTGVTSSRNFALVITGLTGTGSTVKLQRSFGEPGTWIDGGNVYTTDQSLTINDGLDNQIIYYRIGIEAGDYVAGTITASLSIASGSIVGVGRVTKVTDSTHVDVEVLTDFGNTSATVLWNEGSWSDFRGWPSAVQLFEGRMWWFGKDEADGSVVDAFNSFDPNAVGDSGPIQRSVGSGPVDSFQWALGLQRLLLGGQASEFTLQSTSFDEPLTPTNFNIKRASTQGSADVQAVPIDNRALFVQRGGTRVFELALNVTNYIYQYEPTDMTAIVPLVCYPGIVRMAIQRQPDTRLHCILSDGTVAVLIYDKVENVNAWLKISSTAAGGVIEDVVVLPGDVGENEDHVYYVVMRTINGVSVRHRVQWAFELDCVGGTLNLQGDSFVTYSGAAVNVITGLGHMEGQQVVVWGDGKDLGTVTDDDGNRSQQYTVAGGQITLAGGLTVENAMVGLYYEGRWQSGKLVQGQSPQGNTLTHHKLIDQLGIIQANAHINGLRYGPDFDTLSDMPLVEDGETMPPDTIWDAYDQEPFTFEGEWNTDARLCLLMSAPRPCTLLAAVIAVDING